MDRDKILFLSFASILLLTGCSQTIVNQYSSGSRIVCFGNSIMYGTGAEASFSIPSILSERIPHDVINAGIPGETSGEALIRIQKDVLDQDPYLVIVEFGGNDFLQKVPMETTLKNMEAIIDQVQSGGAMVVLCDVSSNFILSRYRRAYKRLAKKKGALFVGELLDGILNRATLRTDYIHPNAEGYKIIAQRLYEAVRDYVK